jgi:hypothetical protein
MCFLFFHKWGPWGDRQKYEGEGFPGPWRPFDPFDPYDPFRPGPFPPCGPYWPPDSVIVGFQERKCLKCGRVQKRYIREFVEGSKGFTLVELTMIVAAILLLFLIAALHYKIGWSF